MKQEKISWESMVWGDLATLEYGKGLRSDEYGNSEGYYPVYGTNGQIGKYNKPLYPNPGIIIGRKGAYRGVHYSKIPFYVIDTAFYLKPKSVRFDIKWAYYQLKHFDINKIDSGSAIPATNREAFYQIPVKVPPIITQHKIAVILSAYDDLMENNLRRIKILEEMAQNLYTEWFVKFRFPGYEKVKMVDSPLGKIPEGWQVGQIKNVVTIKSGFAFSSKTYCDTGKYQLVTIRNVQDGVFMEYCQDRLSEVPSNLPHYCYLNDGDVLLSLTGNIGRVCVVYGQYYLLNQRVCKLVPLNPNNKAFIYNMFRNSQTREKLERLSTGVAQQNLSPVKTEEMKIIIPPPTLLSRYSTFSTPIIQQILNLYKTNSILRQTRDLLLPKLISGELDVSDMDIKTGNSV